MSTGQTSGMNEMHQSMMKGMKEMQPMQMSGDSDRDFATMMRMHHQMGIEMAETEVKSGRDAKMKNMATKMIDEQKRDIRELDEWLKQQKR